MHFLKLKQKKFVVFKEKKIKKMGLNVKLGFVNGKIENGEA